MSRCALFLALTLIGSGCRVPPKGGLDEVTRLLDERGVGSLRWNQSRREDDEARQVIDQLLSEELTPARAVQIALVGSSSIQATLERLGVAQADAVQAGLLKNPSIGVHPGLPIGSPSWSGVAWEVSVAMEILDLFVLPLRKKLARLEFERARLVVAADLWVVVTEVRTAYYEALAAAQRLALQQTLAENADAAADFASRQERAGTLSELALANEQASYTQVRLDLVRAERDAVSAREKLVRALGLWADPHRIKLPATLPMPPRLDPDVDRMEQLAIAQRLDLRAAEQEAVLFERTVKMAKGMRFLTGLSIGGDAHREPEGGYKVIGPSISLELPIFDQGQARIAKLVAETRRARRHAEALAVEIRSEVRERANRLLASRSLADYLRSTVIPLRERTVSLSQQQYNAMFIGLPQLLMAKQAEAGAWREYLECVRDYWVARAELERATGGPLMQPAPASHLSTGDNP